MRLGGAVAVALVASALVRPAHGFEQPVSAFAGGVGKTTGSGDGAVTVYVVPPFRTFLLTDVLVANYGGESGPLYLADSQRTRCSLHLLQSTLINGQAPGFATLTNVHETFTTGTPYGPGEPVIATLTGGIKGVDVTITGKLVPGPRQPTGTVRIPGGARDGAEGAAGDEGGKP